MSKRWKLKTNASNILLVLITLILIKAEWVKCASDASVEVSNSLEDRDVAGQSRVYVGNDEIAHYYFRPRTSNGSLALEGVRNCLDSFQLITCVKMLLLTRVDEMVEYVEEAEVAGKDLSLLNGLVVFKKKNEPASLGPDEKSDILSLDEEIASKVLRIFRNRFFLVNSLPKFRIEVEPKLEPNNTDFVCLSFKMREESEAEDRTDEGAVEGRGKKKGGGMGMMMLVPQMIMLGLMPFTLASLKAMVMNAVMINMMALNGAIFMTIRNLVFGPRRGENVKYVNYGYSKDRQTQSKKPVLIIHSPAAFVKQPPVKTKHFNRETVRFHKKPNFETGNYFPTGDSSLFHRQHGDNSGNKDYYVIQDEDSHYEHGNRRSTRRKEQGSSFGMPGPTSRNQFRTVKYQRSAKPEAQTDQNRKRGFNESLPGLAYSNSMGKKAGDDYNYSRQVGEPLRLL